MASRSENRYNIVLGTLGFGTLFYLTIFTKEYIELNLTLFFLLAVVGILLERIHLRVGEFTITLDTIITLGSYFILGDKVL